MAPGRTWSGSTPPQTHPDSDSTMLPDDRTGSNGGAAQDRFGAAHGADTSRYGAWVAVPRSARGLLRFWCVALHPKSRGGRTLVRLSQLGTPCSMVLIFGSCNLLKEGPSNNLFRSASPGLLQLLFARLGQSRRQPAGRRTKYKLNKII